MNIMKIYKLCLFSLLAGLILISCAKEESLDYTESAAETSLANIKVTLAMHSPESDCSEIENIGSTSVFLYNSEGNVGKDLALRSGTTDLSGQYTFRNLEEGEYFVSAKYDGQEVSAIARVHGKVRTAFVELVFEGQEEGENGN